jgi:anti-anti-sigma factor
VTATVELAETGDGFDAPRLGIDVLRSAGHVVLTLSGELCEVTAEELDGAIDDSISFGVHASPGAVTRDVTLDLSGLTFLSAAGLAVFAAAERRLRLVGSRLHLVGAQPIARRMLVITQLDRLIVGPPQPLRRLSLPHP